MFQHNQQGIVEYTPIKPFATTEPSTMMSVRDFLFKLLDHFEVRRVQSEKGKYAFIIVTERYPELVISPAPWSTPQAKENLLAWLEKVEFIGVASKNLTESGFRYEVTVRSTEGVEYSIQIRRFPELLQTMIRERILF